MYRSVYELTPDEINELKWAYFYSDEYDNTLINNARLPILFPADIPDEIIFEHYCGIIFVEEDFSCNIKED